MMDVILGGAHTVCQVNRLVGGNDFAEAERSRSRTPHSPDGHAWLKPKFEQVTHLRATQGVRYLRRDVFEAPLGLSTWGFCPRTGRVRTRTVMAEIGGPASNARRTCP